MIRRLSCWLVVFVFASVALAQVQKERVSVAPPKADLILNELPPVEDPAIAFQLHTRRVAWEADHPLKLVGGPQSFLLLERLYDADPVREPEKALSRVLGEKGAAELAIPVRRKTEQPLTLFFGHAKPFSDRQDNQYLVTAGVGDGVYVLAYRSVRGRNHVTSGDSRLEVIDFSAKVAIAFVGNWLGSEKRVGIDDWPAEKLDVDDVRIIRIELDDQFRSKSSEALLVRRLYMRHYLAGDASDPAKNHGTESHLTTYMLDSSGPDGLRCFPSWADARAASSKTMRQTLEVYAAMLSGGIRTPRVFAEAVLSKRFSENPREQYPVGGPVNPSRIGDEGALVVIPWLRHSTNHAPTLGVTEPAANLERWRKVCAAGADEKALLPTPLFDPQTSTHEIGDIAVELGPGCKLKAAHIRSAFGWQSLDGRTDLEAATADALKLAELTPEAMALLHALLVASAESPPDKKGGGEITGVAAKPRKRK
jgi:hypothetical protein